MGWRYFSDVATSVPAPHVEVVDVAVDAGWRPARVRTRERLGDDERHGFARDSVVARSRELAEDRPACFHR